VTNNTVHRASRCNKEQTVADPDGTVKLLPSGLFATDVDVSIDVILSVLILGFFTITYPFYAHFILPI